MTACGGGGGDAPVVLSSQKAITAYALAGVSGTIDESGKTIAVAVPGLTNVTGLAAVFTSTGASVKVSSTPQVSGVTVNNFTLPVVYTVTAQDGTTQTYTVTVTQIPAAWYHPLNLADNLSPDGEEVSIPHAAMDANGNAIIVWYQCDASGYYQIFKSEYRNGNWSHPAGLTDNISPDGQNAFNPRVAMDLNGNAIIVWYQYSGADFQIYKSEYRGGAWSHPASLSDAVSLAGQNAFNPQAAMDTNGNAIIVWYQSDGAKYQIYKSERRAGVWFGPASLNDHISPAGQDAHNPQTAMDASGNTLIAWHQSDGLKSQIFKSEYRAGAWTHPAGLADSISPDGQDAWDPQTAMDANGDALIVWWQQDGTHFQIFKSEYRLGVWAHPSGLTDNISPDGHNALIPQVAMDANGNAVMVWYQYISYTSTQIFKSEYRAGVWAHPATLADFISPGGQNALYPSVALDANSNVVIAWYQSDGVYDQIFKSEYRAGVWSHPSGLTDCISPDGQNARNPQAVASDTGSAIIVWRQYNDEPTPVWQVFKSEYK